MTNKTAKASMGLEEGQTIEVIIVDNGGRIESLTIEEISYQNDWIAEIDATDGDGYNITPVYGKFYSVYELQGVYTPEALPGITILLGHEDLVIISKEKGLLYHSCTR